MLANRGIRVESNAPSIVWLLYFHPTALIIRIHDGNRSVEYGPETHR